MNNLKKITYAALISVLTIGAFDGGVTLIPTAEATPMRPAYDEQRVMTRAEFQEVQERLDRLARARPDLNSRINRTRARLNRLRFIHIGSKEMASLNRDLLNLSILAMDRVPSQKAAVKLRIENNALRAENNDLQAENNKLREGVGFLKDRSERLREDNAELRKANDILVSKTAAMREKIARLSTALASARAQVSDMQERFATAVALRVENAELKESILKLRKHAAATNAQVDRLRDEIRNLRARIAASHRHRPRRAS